MDRYVLLWIKVNGEVYAGEEIESYFYPTTEDPWFAIYFKDGKFLTTTGNIEIMRKKGDA